MPRWKMAALAACVMTVSVAAFGVPAVPADETNPPTILVSRQVLERHGLSVGDVVELAADPSGAGARRFRIAGSYEPMADPVRLSADRQEARLHLPDLVALTADRTDPLSSESVSAINVALADPSDAARFARDVAARVPGLTVQGTASPGGRSDPFVVLEQFHLAIAIVTIVGSAVFLLALMVMLVDERRETVGTLRLIGLTRGRILAQVLAEGAIIAAAGAVFGIAFATATEGAFNRFFQWRYDTSLVFVRITPAVAWRSVLVALPLGVLASLMASWTILRRDVLVLIRR